MPEEADDHSDSSGTGADRRVAPYSGETHLDVDPVEPPDRGADEPAEPELPEEALETAERLTRLARRVPDDAEAAAYRRRRQSTLSEHGYGALVREDDDGPVLVCHPLEWLDESGDLDPAAIDAIGRAAEVPLEGADDPEGWAAVAERNDRIVEAVRDAHGDVHAANAAALAEYASNHHAKPIAGLTAAELRWFREEYYVRNVWPSEAERGAIDRSIDLVFEELSVPRPED